ncbi:MAG: MarR family winged helix-turn-helix transcriptional regulator [Nocardioidaceae bacterium]
MGWGAEIQGRGAEAPPPVAALLRRPSVWVRHQVMGELRRAGFADVLPAHLGVFQHPGPDGMRPGVLAARTRSSKQAMNHLLHQLETAGYLRRESHPRDRRTRVVRLTERGRAVARVITETCLRIEESWAAALGEQAYDEMRTALLGLEKLLDEVDLG